MSEQGGEDDGNDDTDEEMEVDTDYSVSVPMQFEQLTRELEVKVYTGLPSTETSSFYCTWGKMKLISFLRDQTLRAL